MYCLRRLFKSTHVSRNASMMSSPCLFKWGIPPKLHVLFLCTELVLATDHVETTKERERERGRDRDIRIYLESPLPFVFGVVCKHIFFGNVWYFLGSFHAKKAFYLPSRFWLYTLSITKLNHVSVLCLSCLRLDQAPSHIIQTQAHN